MNYYLTPEPIVEVLGLTQIRKSTSAGLFLLSEYDLAPYGIDKAVSEGAIELSDNLPPLPGSDVQSPPVEEPREETSQEEEPAEESATAEEEPADETVPIEEEPETKEEGE